MTLRDHVYCITTSHSYSYGILFASLLYPSKDACKIFGLAVPMHACFNISYRFSTTYFSTRGHRAPRPTLKLPIVMCLLVV